ncbi:dual specificity protein phosphatase 9 [Eurytemora carolleeae]|uniref:dual specificity protein phosphatase 9 n=1 Tax=Eurytemora carolleeae TaxID=1294199 RepID=UPI000C78FD13|nr:dual specificity protein phosphatase 9 [Eurytemora carolleeae]|eukprot:XP_023337271.1 dual specificity protein phosphatase 9-like [Eurytemora affinis]
MTASAQICFTGDSGCPNFDPNQFKSDVCKICSKKIQSHIGATKEQICSALEYIVDSIPTLVLLDETGGGLYMGGYKAGLNIENLKNKKVGLVVCTAGGLERVLGPKYKQQLEQRHQKLTEIEDLFIDLSDDLEQVLDFAELTRISERIQHYLELGSSVLVHCAQGKSRSAVVVVFHLRRILNISFEEALKRVKQARSMAEPNPNFINQLINFERTERYKQKVNQPIGDVS